MLQVVPLVGVVEGEAKRLVLGESHRGQLERLVGPERGMERHRRPDDAVEEQLASTRHDGHVPEDVTDEHRDPRLGGGAFHRLRGDDGVGHRLLHEHGHPSTAGLLGECCVGGVGSGDDDAVGAPASRRSKLGSTITSAPPRSTTSHSS